MTNKNTSVCFYISGNEYGNGYAYAYKNRIKWDSPLKYTVDMIKEDENDKGNNTADVPKVKSPN